MDEPEYGNDPDVDVEEIEQVLKEIAEAAPDVPRYGLPDFGPEEADGASIPEDLPVAEEYTVAAAVEPDPEPEGENESSITFESPVEYADCREVAVAEPMTVHDASLVALGDNVRQVTNLIESVGRTLEAQNQRTLRLMERLESVVRALETLPEEADRGLEGLDAVEEAILAQRRPLDEINGRLSSLPDAVQAMRDQSTATRELWNTATRAMASRMAFTAYEERMRERSAQSRSRWRVLAGAALAIAAFVGGATMSATDIGAEVRNGLAAVLTADKPSVQADEGELHWRVIEVKRRVQQQLPVAPEEPLGTDEEAK